MQDYVKSIKVIGVHNRFDIQQEFKPGINILYGKNGTCKTTLLHILANILNGDYRRLFYLSFVRIELTMSNDETITIKWDGYPYNLDNNLDNNSEKTLIISRRDKRRDLKIRNQYSDENIDTLSLGFIRYEPLIKVAYFPAFRTMIEAWASVEEDSRIRSYISQDLPERLELSDIKQVQATRFSRKLFGQFVPQINYPSPLEIEQKLIDEIREAILAVAQIDREMLSRSFIDIFAALSPLESNQALEKSEIILAQIKSLSEEIQNYPLQDKSVAASGIYSKLNEMLNSVRFDDNDSRQVAAQVLIVYRDSLKKIVDIQKKSFAGIERYLAAVNEFLERKKLKVHGRDTKHNEPSVELELDDGSSLSSLSALSSGERQIITLIYAATHMSQQNMVLIDEPEISLHIDWQRLLLKKMYEQLPNLQIIACTHSPVIAADYEDCLMELQLMPTDKSQWFIDNNRDEDKAKSEENFIGSEDDFTDEENIIDFEDDFTDNEEEVLS